MNFRERLLANRRRRNYVLSKRKIEADYLDRNDLLDVIRKVAGTRIVSVDGENPMGVSVYIDGFTANAAIRKTIMLLGVNNRKPFELVGRIQSIKGKVFIAEVECSDNDATIEVVTVEHGDAGCTLSLVQYVDNETLFNS